MRCEQTPAWAKLANAAPPQSIAALFEADPQRLAAFSLEAVGLYVDFSKQAIERSQWQELLALAQQCDVPGKRDAMLRGEAVNRSEGRAVLHTALRGGPLEGDEIRQAREELLSFAEAVRGNASITDVVNIGIGGSDLGPQMVCQALAPHAHPRIKLHFVSNVDGHDLTQTLTGLSPRNTLFIVTSKTFGTRETLLNAQSAKAWFLAGGGSDFDEHFVAVSAKPEVARSFGISRCFGFWDWVGGRYSLWSAVGLAIAVSIGRAQFQAFLAGAAAMDRHFAQAPMNQNLPVALGLLDVYQRNFLRYSSRSIAPYHFGLRRLPAFLQQLEMESNGKHVDADGVPLGIATGGVIWGEAGTNGQHAYFQLLHQGTEIVPTEFIAAKRAATQLEGHQRVLLANLIAQARALMLGRGAAKVLGAGGSAQLSREALSRARSFSGNRPSTVILMDELTPERLGSLLAMYEHRTFVQGAIWGINSFDQWGVELGKSLAEDIEARFVSGDSTGLDASSSELLKRLV